MTSTYYNQVFVVTELFNIAVTDFDAIISARWSRVFVVTELVLSVLFDTHTHTELCRFYTGRSQLHEALPVNGCQQHADLCEIKAAINNNYCNHM